MTKKVTACDLYSKLWNTNSATILRENEKEQLRLLAPNSYKNKSGSVVRENKDSWCLQYLEWNQSLNMWCYTSISKITGQIALEILKIAKGE